jgi:hypothetical protein
VCVVVAVEGVIPRGHRIKMEMMVGMAALRPFRPRSADGTHVARLDRSVGPLNAAHLVGAF